jgi:hypothetical protein
MADREPHEELSAGTRAVVEDAVKTAIEQALVSEVVLRPEAAMSFSRIFNKDAPDFSRLFSRGGTQLETLKVRELTTMEDAAFAKFTERVRILQATDLTTDQ